LDARNQHLQVWQHQETKVNLQHQAKLAAIPKEVNEYIGLYYESYCQ